MATVAAHGFGLLDKTGDGSATTSAGPPDGIECASITRMTAGIRSEVELGPEDGLPEVCVITCDNVITVPLDDLDDEPVGHLDEVTRARLDQAMGCALDIVY